MLGSWPICMRPGQVSREIGMRPPNRAVELTAGSHSLAAAAHCWRWAVVAEARKKVRRTKDQVLGDEWREEA